MPSRGVVILNCILATVVLGCGRPEQPAAQPPTTAAQSVVLLAAYAGVLPCADCAGIRTELRLFAHQPSGQAVRYELRETYLGTRDGDRTFERAGRWMVMRGTPDDNDATVYQLDSDQPDRARNFLRVGDAELRVLDRDQRPIASAIPQSLQRMADDDAVTPLTLVEKDAGKSVEVKRGQTVVVRLDSNRSTGYRWTLIEADSSVLTSTGAAVYEERAAGGPVGGSGTETWSFVVAKYGEQQLVFEYRRPWESDLPAARSVSYTVRAVR